MQAPFIVNRICARCFQTRVSSSSQTGIADSEYNIDPNCLSRCSTEFFSENSWEQVDKQDTEVKEMFPNLFVFGSSFSIYARQFTGELCVPGDSLVSRPFSSPVLRLREQVLARREEAPLQVNKLNPLIRPVINLSPL